MILLDCTDFERARGSVCQIFGVRSAELDEAIAAFDPHQRDVAPEPFENLLLRDVSLRLGKPPEDLAFDGTCFFHLTRSLDPGQLRRSGILPLGEILDELWAALGGLIADVVSPEEWGRFRARMEEDEPGDYAYLYRLKAHDQRHWGPFAVLVRESAFKPATIGAHDYLAMPEIVEDIALSVQAARGVDLAARYAAASKPVIVKFSTPRADLGALASALCYLRGSLDGEGGTHASIWGFDAGARRVPREDVVAVEVGGAHSRA